MKLRLIFEMDGFRHKVRLEAESWDGLADLAKRSTFIFALAKEDFLEHEEELAKGVPAQESNND
jgi:predicted DNA-binding ribbon-helix-helix protein